MDEAGLPKGVLSVLPTTKPRDVTTALIDDGRLRKMTFTGSTGVGTALAKQGIEKLLRLSMELGGNAPFLVFDDADVDAAVDGAILAKMRNGGEACTAANRFHVANSVREEFTEKLVKRMSEFTLGNGLDESSTLGPLINAKQVVVGAGPGVRRGVHGCDRGRRRRGTRRPGPLLPGDGARRRARRCAHPQGGGVRARRADHRLRHRGRRRSPRPTTPNTDWRPTSTRSRWTGRCGWPRPSSPAWSASTAA